MVILNKNALIHAVITKVAISAIKCTQENNTVETTHIEIRTMNDNIVITPFIASVKKEPLLKDENEARTEKNKTKMYGAITGMATS